METIKCSYVDGSLLSVSDPVCYFIDFHTVPFTNLPDHFGEMALLYILTTCFPRAEQNCSFQNSYLIIKIL